MFLFRKQNRSLPLCPAGEPDESAGCFTGSVLSDLGHMRPNNEDNYILDRYMNEHSQDHSQVSLSLRDTGGQWHFAAVFDGMGGGEMGEAASAAAARIFLDAVAALSPEASKQQVDLAIRGAFLEANNAVISLRHTCNVLGTTGTVCCMSGREFKLYHLGDSRAYLFREDQLFQLTRDQTLAQMKLDAGLCDPSAQPESDRHTLTDYIGQDRTRERLCPVESQWIPLEQKDRVLLCSDGLYDMCPDPRIQQILQQCQDPQSATRSLTEEALRGGGRDNVTCIVVQYL